MTDTKLERTTHLRVRRRAQPKGDEQIDYRRDMDMVLDPAENQAAVAIPAVLRPDAMTDAKQSRHVAEPAPARGRTRHEVTGPMGTRLSLDVVELIDGAVSAAREAGEGPQAQRAAVKRETETNLSGNDDPFPS
jgi:hypothetical protein